MPAKPETSSPEIRWLDPEPGLPPRWPGRGFHRRPAVQLAREAGFALVDDLLPRDPPGRGKGCR